MAGSLAGIRTIDAVLAHPVPPAPGYDPSRIGLVVEALASSAPEVANAVTAAAEALRRAGIDVVEVDASSILATANGQISQVGDVGDFLGGALVRDAI